MNTQIHAYDETHLHYIQDFYFLFGLHVVQRKDTTRVI